MLKIWHYLNHKAISTFASSGTRMRFLDVYGHFCEYDANVYGYDANCE